MLGISGGLGDLADVESTEIFCRSLIRVASILLYLRWLWFFDVLWTCESEAQEIECHREFGKDLDCGCGTDAGLSASCHVNTMNYSLALGIAWAIGQNIGVASGNSQGVS